MSDDVGGAYIGRPEVAEVAVMYSDVLRQSYHVIDVKKTNSRPNLFPPSLVQIRKIDQPAPVKFAVFNARSICNKHAYICDRILSDRITFCAVVETWHDASDCPNLIPCAPPGYTGVCSEHEYDQHRLRRV